jgi:hypothetical protein
MFFFTSSPNLLKLFMSVEFPLLGFIHAQCSYLRIVIL